MTVKAVIFDLGGVLERVDDDAWPEVWIGRWERRMGLRAGHVLAWLAEHEPVGDVVTGGISEAQLRQRYADALGLGPAQADEMMAEMWDAYCGELDTELRDFAMELRPDWSASASSRTRSSSSTTRPDTSRQRASSAGTSSTTPTPGGRSRRSGG